MASFFGGTSSPPPGYIDLNQPSLWLAVSAIIFCPVYWNFVARLEHKNHFLTKLAGGSPYLGCYALALSIFTFSGTRDHLVTKALADQPTHPFLSHPEFKYLAAVLSSIAAAWVLGSMWKLGITGTYLGDYFGILMDEPVTSFPFSMISDPMYYGSTLFFLSGALWEEKPAGLYITAVVFVMYKIALLFEEPFTSKIYADRAAAQQSSKTKTEDVKGASEEIKNYAGGRELRSRKKA